MKRIAILSGMLLAIVMAALLYPAEFLTLSGALLFGWINFLRRVVPQAEVNWPGILTGLVFVVLLVAVLHLFAGWCYRVGASPGRRWRFRWTLSMALALFLMFVAGYSTIGLARHVGWICSSRAALLDVKETRH